MQCNATQCNAMRHLAIRLKIGQMATSNIVRVHVDTMSICSCCCLVEKNASEMLVAPQISQWLGLPWSALVCHSLPWAVSDHQRMALNARTYKWMGLGWDWKSLNTSLLRAPLCGANNRQPNLIFMQDFLNMILFLFSVFISYDSLMQREAKKMNMTILTMMPIKMIFIEPTIMLYDNDRYDHHDHHHYVTLWPSDAR